MITNSEEFHKMVGGVQRFLSTMHPHSQDLPQEIAERILKDARSLSIFRRYAENIVVKSGDRYTYILDKDNARVSWSYEPHISSPSANKFISIPLFPLSTLIYLGAEAVDENRVNLDSWLYKRMQFDLVRYENKAFLYGDGEKKPLGLLKKDCSQKIEIESNHEIKAMIDATVMLKDIYRAGAIWMVSPKFYANLKEREFDKITHIFSDDKSISSSILGHPVVICDDLEPSHACVLVDLSSAYCIVDHQEMKVIQDKLSFKPNYEVYFGRKVGGAPLNGDALVVLEYKQ